MTTVYVVKFNDKQEGYATADVFSTYELAQAFCLNYQTLGNVGVLEIVPYELDKPNYPFLKVPKPFILSFTDEDGQKQYLGVVRRQAGIDRPYLSTDRSDAFEYDAGVSKGTLLFNLERYFRFVNLKVEEV